MVPKIIIHAWKLLWNRITTTLKLLKRGCVPPNVSTNCIFCDSEVESIRYVFFECICIPCLDGGSTILNEKLSINSTFKLFLKFLLIPQILILLLFNLCVLPPIKKKIGRREYQFAARCTLNFSFTHCHLLNTKTFIN